MPKELTPARREEALDVDPEATGAEQAPDGALARRQLRAAIDEAKEALPRRERDHPSACVR